MAADSNQKDRRLKRQARYQSFVWMRPLATDYIPSLGHLIRLSFLDLKNNWIFFSILGVIFAAGLGFLWFGFGQYLDLDINQQRLESLFGDGGLDRIQIAFEQLQYIGSGLSDLSQNFNFYAAAFLTILSLTLISFGRRIQTEDRRQSQSPRAVLDAIYFGSSQLIPYILVILFLFGQALPGLIANGIVVHLNTNGVLESNVETAVGLAGALWANLLCFYMISGSIFGLMIVSRPGSRPATSWQSSWDLTTNRRRRVSLYLIGAILVGLTATVVVMIPILIFLTAIAEYIFSIWLVGLFIWGHLYFGRLYQALLETG